MIRRCWAAGGYSTWATSATRRAIRARSRFAKGGDLIVALAGVDEIAITASPDQGPRRIVVGHRPAAVAPSPDGLVVYVADSLDDTVSVVEIKSGMRRATIALGPRPELTSAQRGERLFSSAKLSHDGWMSCHSCHSDGHTNNLVCDTLGDGSYGAAEARAFAAWRGRDRPWTWTGSMARLEDQVSKSIATTMHGTKLKDSQIADLKAYLETLSPPSRITVRRWRSRFAGGGQRAGDFPGAQVRVVPRTAGVHVAGRYDVGLRDEVGNREFNPPSLRGAKQPRFILARRPIAIARGSFSEGEASAGVGADSRGKSPTWWLS